MHRNRTWLLDPIELRTQRNRILPIEGGDGSTLSLDFTTGVLDPRLTFTRSSDATFINSSGLVQYADANWVQNSTMLVSTDWTVNVVNGGTATINGDGSVTFSSTAGRVTWLQTLGLMSGLQATFSIQVTALTAGDIRVSDLFQAGFGFGSQVYHHTSPSGVTQNNISPTAGIGTFGVGLYSVTATTTGTVNNIIFGTDCNGVNRTGSVTIRDPQFQYGTVVPRRVYVPNSSTTSTKWDSPRFDHDPTTGSPRGLLIEGSANNLATNSSSMWNWGTSGPTKVQDTAVADIFGVTGTSNITTKVVKASGAGSQFTTLSFAIPQITVPANTIVDVTLSMWIRMDGANQPKCSLGILDTGGVFGATFGTQSPGGRSVSNSAVTMTSGAGADCDYTFGLVTGWVRCSVSRRLNNTTASPINWTTGLALLYPDRFTANAATIYVCGAQIETGIGPSSWLPTGASQGTRNADKMSMTDISTMQWNQAAGTFALHMDVAAETNTSSFPAFMGMYTATPVRVVRFLLNNSSGTNPRIGNDTWTATPTQILSNLITRSAAPTAFKVAVSLSNTGQTLNQVVNAGGVTTTSGTGTMQTPTRVLWHQDPSALDTEYFPIHIRSMKYWPTALPNAQLQSLTT